MNTIFHNNNHRPMEGRSLFITSILLNVGALFSNISPVLKGILVTITALTTIMAFFNQYKTFQKNFKTLWIVVTVNHVFTFLKPKKNRHRGISINKKKIKKNDESILE